MMLLSYVQVQSPVEQPLGGIEEALRTVERGSTHFQALRTTRVKDCSYCTMELSACFLSFEHSINTLIKCKAFMECAFSSSVTSR